MYLFLYRCQVIFDTASQALMSYYSSIFVAKIIGVDFVNRDKEFNSMHQVFQCRRVADVHFLFEFVVFKTNLTFLYNIDTEGFKIPSGI